MKDFATIERLVEDNFKLARFHANRALDLDFDEALSAALDGLHTAAQQFDSERGIPFGSFASRYIKWSLSSLRKFNNAEKRNKSMVAFSLDAPLGDDNENTFSDIIADKTTTDISKNMGCEGDDKKLLMEFFHKLTTKQQNILSDVFGIGRTVRTIEAVAAQLNVSHSRVSQITENALKQLRHYLKSYHNDLRPNIQSNLRPNIQSNLQSI